MARPHSTRYTVAALLLLGIAVVILVSLGQWQLRRSDERRAILAAIEAGRKQAPLMLTPATPSDSMTPWRVAQASGAWLPQFSVLLDNRNHDGRPGYWLATPLLLDASSRQAVLVLRGWLPRVIQGQGEPKLPAPPEGMQVVTGELSDRVPRMFELWSLGGQDQSALPKTLPVAGGAVPQVQNLPIAEYARATGLNLLPVVLSQADQGANDGLVRDWPQPSVDFQKNTSYAVQWFAFGLIAAIAWLVVLGGAIRRMRQRAPDGPQA
ncbi:SURF1 family protein [Achromobacter pestifer]|uniref:SURF1-like protein n=1 Tax=Achromobacter pestifer TaxID=1353889 RepID=A0A6S6Z6W6_9BURK|nr:SURF1 family protein [Achromobacter pestifer]CAB3662751.1 putative SURF1-like protein [Achromobacter pestifer]